MTQMIVIRPTAMLRRAFAEWAVGQRPKIRTMSTFEFAVPARLFVDVPESVLIGALVDGHRYVSPDEDVATGRLAPGAPRLLGCGLCYQENGQEVHPHPECTAGAVDLLGVATAEGFAASESPLLEAVPGEPLPEVPAEAYGPDSVPLPAVAEVTAVATDGVFPCGGCDREFTTERGRDLHARAKHPEVSDGS